MKFIIGSLSSRKIDSARKVLSQLIDPKTVDIEGFGADSGVPDTPWDHETPTGAHNRAEDAKKAHPAADYYIGLESGLVERYGEIYEEAWCSVLTPAGEEFTGYSSGLRLPKYVTDKMKASGLEHSDVMAELEELHNLTDSDTWGSYSGNLILREVSLEEAMRNALIQVFAAEHSLYKITAAAD